MPLGDDRDADGGGPAHEEEGTCRPGNTGTKASAPSRRRAQGSEPALRPGHDHAEPGYPPPVRVPHCRLLAFLRVFYPRSLKSQ